MRDKDSKLNKGELTRIKSLIGDADGGDFSLDEIMAEYASPPLVRNPARTPPDALEEGPLPPRDPPAPPPERPPAAGKVVPFPGSRAVPREEPDAAADEESRPHDSTPSSKQDNVVAFPEEESNPIASLLHSLERKADNYAEHMFENEDLPHSDETRRMERLIPGVDREEQRPPFRERRPRRQDPPEPDVPPQELAHRCGKGLGGLHVRMWLVFLLFLPALFLLLEPLLPELQLPHQVQQLLAGRGRVLLSAGLLGAAVILSLDLFWNTLRRLFRLRLGMDTLLMLACLATLGDALTMSALCPRPQLPYCAVNILGLFLALRGEYHRRRGVRLACRTAAAAAEPYLVTLDEGKWNGRDAYVKWSGPSAGFGSQIQADDGAQRIFRVVCPLLLCACVLFSLLSSVGAGRPGHLLWCLSATLTASCALSAPTLFSRPFHTLSRRLMQSGAALAGWPGAADSRRNAGILLTDLDLFPPGSVTLNGIKVFGSWPTERVVSYTATLIRDSGCGLDKLFHDLLRTQGAIYRQADRLCWYEGGGLSANIRGDQVLVGSAAFMSLMEVPLPQGLKVKSAVFCAIDGELAGIFALSYTLPDLVFPSITALLQEKISPILATRDFNIIPAMLRQRFRLAAERMDFPPVDRRRELSDPGQPHSGRLCAVLCREGLYPFSEAVVGARRLRVSVRLNAVLACTGSAIGTALAYYLTAVEAFASISPVNLLVYLLLWLLPSWFVSGWTDQY